MYTKKYIVISNILSRLTWAGHAWRTDDFLIKMVMVKQINR